MDMKPDDYAQEMMMTHNLTYESMKTYRQTLTHYSNLMEMSLTELLLEADKEEEEGIRWKHRTLRKRLIHYQNHLLKTYRYNTAKSYMTKLKTWYYDHDIEIGKLPPMNKKQGNVSEPITYDDLPTKEILRKAYNLGTPVFKAILLFTISSGCGKQEVLNLKLDDYYDWITPYSVEQILSEDIDIVPTIRLRRQKTNKYYTTFCSPEAVREIATYLQTRKDNSPKLFKISYRHLTQLCVNYNRLLGLGTINDTGILRMHMLRKFHASNLYNAENGLSLDEIDSLQGRSKNTIRESYYFNSVEDLKKKYIRNIDQVTILDEVHTITIDSPEVELLKKKAAKIDELEQLVKKIIKKSNGGTPGNG